MNPTIDKRPTWDQYFINICKVVASRSSDPDTQVGCVIVDDRNRICATGYNGYPPKCNDMELPHTRPEKYDWMTHAEQNAIAACGRDLRGCTIYVNILPCPACMRLIVVAGIKVVKYFSEYESRHCMNNDVVFEMARQCGVEIVRIRD